MTGIPIAHVRFDARGEGIPHPLEDHLSEVGRLAGEFANAFGNGDWGKIAGLWHDLGKYKADFQEYIRARSGYERDEADEGGPGNDISLTAGERNSQSDPQFSNSLLEISAGVHSLRGEKS